MIASRDPVFLVHVGCRETMEEREPGAGAPVKFCASHLAGATCMRDEFGPAIAVARDGARCLQLDRRVRTVQPFDQGMPGGIGAQIFRFVDDARAIFEGENMDAAAAMMRIGKIGLDRAHAAGRGTLQDVALDGGAIGIEAQDEFTGRVDPLSGERCD